MNITIHNETGPDFVGDKFDFAAWARAEYGNGDPEVLSVIESLAAAVERGSWDQDAASFLGLEQDA